MIDESDKGGSDGLVQLSSTLRTLSTLTSDPGDVVPEELAEGWRQVSQLLNEADCKVSDLLAVTRAAQQEQLLHSTLQGWNRQLLALKSGACALLPLAWSTSVSSRHAVLVVLRRRGDYGTLALVNLAGSGSEYHPQQLSDCATRPWRQISPVTCSSIPWSRLSSTVFWLFMLRPLVTGLALDEPHPALLYEALLPFLTKKVAGSAPEKKAEAETTEAAAASTAEDRGTQLRRQMSSKDWGVRWCPVPRHDDTKIHAVFEALTLALQSSHPPAVAEWLLLILRFQWLKASPEPVSCRALARRAAELGEVQMPEPLPTWKPSKILDHIESWLSSKLDVKEEGRTWPLGVHNLELGSLNLSGFQRLIAFREEEVEEAERPPLVLPVPLVLVSRDTVQDYHEASVALRNCVRSCALLMNQRGLVSNADRHVVAMTQHLFYEVLPMPLPISKGVSACFWRKMPMYYETQGSLVRELWLVVQYFLASSLSLPLNTHHHSVRLLTLVSALSVLDAVVRRNPPHSQNDLSRVYSGALRGSQKKSGAFTVDLQLQLAESTEELPLWDPHAQEIRSGLLDYFATAGDTHSRKARRVFAFNDMRLNAGDKELIHRLALLRGCVSGSCVPDSARLGRYLTGEVPELLSAFPGLAALRDVTFLVHLLCVKITSATLDIRRPDGTPWNASDLLLKWEYNAEEGRLRVTGLGRSLVLGEAALQPERTVETSGFLSRLGSAMTSLWSSQVQTPALVSAAGASHLANQSIQSEDDVLHTPDLPSFGKQLSQAESEELLSFLTVPYLRVPLLLQFFNNRKRFTALNHPQLQAMLDAVLFEPGAFEEQTTASTACPDTVYPGLMQSAQGAQLLTTPAGRLVHELVNSPSTVLGELDGIFRLAMERDVPHYSSASSAVLYAVRLWTRVTAYAGLVARSSNVADAAPRGWVASTGNAKMLREKSKSWASRLLVEAVPMLERWCRRAMAAGEMQISCMLWLHLALIQRWSGDVDVDAGLTPHGVSTLLCAELFLNANLDTSGMGTRSQAEQLGFLETEIYELFHSTRSRVYRWLRTKTSERDKVFEHVVSTVASSPGLPGPSDSAVRRWVELEDTWDGHGRFAAAGSGASSGAYSGCTSPTEGVSADEDFPRWLSASVDSAPVEVNVNLGQLQFRQHNVTAVPKEVMELPEFQEVFPNVEIHSCLLWALVEKAKQRERYRFAGLRYEFHLWKLDKNLPEIPYSRRFPQHATVPEKWIESAISSLPEMQTLWTRGSWYAPKESQGQSYAHLYVSHGHLRSDQFHYEDGYSRAAQEDEVGDYKIFEVEVFRHGAAGLCPAVVHVYHVCRVGPRFGRTQVLTSSSGWSHSICDEDLLPRLLNSRHLLRSAMSLEIVREELSGESKLVPRFALKGALPDALLEQYEFWRGERRLVGKLQRRTGDAPLTTPSCLVVHLSERCHVQRLALDLPRKDPEKQLDELMFAKSSNVVQGETLVDLLHAKQTSSTYQVAQWLLHLDDLSHVLAWSSAQVLNGELMDLEKEPPLTLVELPRLGLSFTADSADAAGGLRCDQHGGLKVVGHRNFHNQKSLERLLKPFPHFVLLEDDFGELFLLSSLAQRPRQTAAEGLQWQRGDESWLSKLRQEQRHQLYRIFTEFLIAPSLLAELHLMLLRVAQGMFSDACSGVMACIASGLPQQPEESLLWDEITSFLRGDARLGAAVLRLKLVLQLHRQGQGIPEGWNPEADFLAWANYGWDSVEGQLLTLEEEAALLDLLGASSEEANWELRARSAVHRSVLQISAARGHVTQGSQGDSDGGGLGRKKVQLQRSKDLGTPGPLERGKVVLDNVPMEPLSLMLESPPDVEGPSHALFLEQDEPGDLKRGVLAVSSLLRCLPLRLSRDFLLLYELLNRSRTVWLLPSDDPALTAELLVRLVPSEELQQRPALAALLRLMESPSIAQRLPKFRSPIETWIPSLLSSLKEFVQEMQDLKHGPSESPGPLPSAFWTFERSSLGTWKLVDCDSVDAKLVGVAETETQETVGSPLSNGRLLEVMRVMGAFGDRRLPSNTWDFDCRTRCLGQGQAESMRGGNEGNIWQGCIKELHDHWPLLAFTQLPALASKPFMSLGLNGVLGSADISVDKDVAALKFLAEQSPMTSNSSGRALLRRLKADFQNFGELQQATFRNITSSTASQVLQERHQLEALQSETESLIQALESMLQEDTKAMYEAMEAAKAMANGAGSSARATSRAERGEPMAVCERLRRLSGDWLEVKFQDILQMLLVEGGIEEILPHLRPSMKVPMLCDLSACALLAMRFSARVLLCRQSVQALRKLKSLADRQLRMVDSPDSGTRRGSWGLWSRLSGRFTRDETEEPLAPELAEASAEAALALGAEAHCMDGLSYDPRLVVFEFISRLVLRKKQVALVRAMQNAVQDGKPLVHQMLMGEGKTTVVTPLVILLHGSATRACVVCVPQALTEFTCRVLRERLCGTLARPVVEFTFNRATPVSDDHFFKLLHAQDARAVMVSGPTGLKSLMLRFVLTLHACDVARSEEKERLEVDRSSTFLSPNSWKSLLRWPSWSSRGGVTSQLEALGFEARALAWALDVFQGAVLILDDIDLLMHPLRSELHWPLGTQHLLDFTATGSTNTLTLREDDQHEATISYVAGSPVGARWQLAFHLLDGFFSCQQGTLAPGPAYSTAQQGDPCAAAVLERLRLSVARGLRQKQLQQAPHLVLLSLDFYHKELRPILADWALVWFKCDATRAAKLRSFWCGDSSSVEDLAKDLGDAQLKAVNLIRSWLSTLFPHLASRIHRVHYGLLDEGSPSWPSEAPARRQLAVPFVGKDAPSESSQFSHPDVLIGLTWLAYRFGGLRQGDFRRAVKSLARQGRLEEAEDKNRKSARRSWAQWVRLSGAHLRGAGTGAEGSNATAAKGDKASHNSKSLVLSDHGGNETQLVPPLEWLDSGDATQLALVFNVMKHSPFLMEFYLHALVLPSLLRHADAKLSANGQDLGGEVLCSFRLGFSGTPNDLLPRSLGKCRYAQGDDAKMLTTLSDPQVVSVSSVEDGWNAHKLLEMVAKQTPPLNALIDVGALITGLSNEQVARTLLDYGLPFEAVVFCDSGGGQQLLRRGASVSVKMSNCTLPLDRRFVFYDQVHTTGIDIRHPPHACAALTLGKDSTFRDFAQGAYRLRGIRKGQRLQVLLTPEVAARIDEEVLIAADTDAQAMAPPPQVSLLDKVCAWLLVRQASAEQTQRRLLSRQAVQYQGRRYAYETLVKKIRTGQGMEAGGLLDLFRERVDYTVEASLVDGGSPVGRSLRQLAETVSSYLDVPGKQAVNVIVSGSTDDAWAQRGEEEQSLFAEMEQEHEQELFAEQEEEKEEEEEEEEEANDTSSPSASSFQKLPRSDAQSEWPLELLRRPPNRGDPTGGYGRHFRPAKAMALGSSRGIETAHFPQELWASQNFHRGEHVQRLRPVVMLLEWMPLEENPGRLEEEGSLGMSPHKSGDISPTQKRTRLHTALELHGLLGKATISAKEVKALLSSLGVTASPSEVELVLNAIVEQAADDACQFDVDDLGENSLEHPLESSSSSVRLLRKALSARTVASALRRCHAVEAEAQRFYALLSLGEAEGLRALMHRRDLPCHAALKLLRRETLNGLMVLDTTKEWKASQIHWHESRLAQSLAFLAAQTHFSQHVLDSLWQQFRTRSPAMILEALPTQAGSGDTLRDFFVASMSCRRSFVQDGAWREAPVAQLFAQQSIEARRARERMLSKVHRHLTHAGISPEAAFSKLDTDEDGEVTPGDFAAADQMGLDLPKERLRLFETLDTAKRGSISSEEWMAAFEITRPAPSVAASHSGEPLPPPEGLPLDVLRRMVIEVVNHTSYTQLWTSKGMLCQKHVSIWAPEQNVASFFRVSLKVSLGHYANRGFSDARGGDSMGVGKRSILQVRDRQTFGRSSDEYLQMVADHYCPAPVRWRQVWSQNRGTPLFLWRPVPPSEGFVALGMVATVSPEPPPLSAARCVCKSFCRPSAEAPMQLWDDSGSGGKPASIWLVNAPQVLWASVGHNPPHETFWELANESITFDYLGRPSLHVVHEVSSPIPRRDSSTAEVLETSSWSLTNLFSSNRRRSY